jgi:hypothetical protein
MSSDQVLMSRIASDWGAIIAQACHLSSVPETFLAALTANESGGDPNASRFEPGIYRHLKAVREGSASHWGSITGDAIADELIEMTLPYDGAPKSNPDDAMQVVVFGKLPTDVTDQDLRALATSWGLVQIMGYHMIGRRGTVAALLDPLAHYRIALELLAEFAQHYGLDMTREFEEMFRCWNTGNPTGKTHDPAYVPNGLLRMKLYRGEGK